MGDSSLPHSSISISFVYQIDSICNSHFLLFKSGPQCIGLFWRPIFYWTHKTLQDLLWVLCWNSGSSSSTINPPSVSNNNPFKEQGFTLWEAWEVFSKRAHICICYRISICICICERHIPNEHMSDVCICICERCDDRWSYLPNEEIIFTDLWVLKIARVSLLSIPMRGRKGTRRWRGEILTDTKKPCQFLSDARDKINSPLFQTGRPYQFPADTGQIQIQPVNKSKSNTCNKSCWPPRTNPAAAASDKSKCVRWTNRICAPTQIRALRPGPCKGGAPPGLGWNIREHFAAWQRQFDRKDHSEICKYFSESVILIECNFLHGKEFLIKKKSSTYFSCPFSLGSKKKLALTV